MKLFIVENQQFAGPDCWGHWQNYLVAAHNAEEAIEHITVEQGCEPNKAYELILPNLERLKKPRICMEVRP